MRRVTHRQRQQEFQQAATGQSSTPIEEAVRIRLPNPWQQTPTNPGLILTIAGKTVPERSIFA